MANVHLRASCRPIVAAADAVFGVLAVLWSLAVTGLSTLPPLVVAFIAVILGALCLVVLDYLVSHAQDLRRWCRMDMATPLNAIIPRDPKEEEFTFPKRDGSTFKAKIMSMRVPELKSLCGEIGQPRGGSKTILLERLKAFSGDTEQWKLLQPGARRSHKGSRTNENESSNIEKKPARKPSAYTQRRNAVFGDAQVGGPVQRSKDTRTDQEKAEMLAWVCVLSIFLHTVQ
ncbi:hypothetical protein FB446DRAFT_790962 [Lentinula raphanica]|nr:hypothetical protein FB446DRAFT_790962 [Lentinula raphanica]